MVFYDLLWPLYGLVRPFYGFLLQNMYQIGLVSSFLEVLDPNSFGLVREKWKAVKNETKIFLKIFFSTACKENQVRFGDYCYEELPNPKDTIEKNANECLDKGAYLWYPESAVEFSFIKSNFPVQTEGDFYHLGIQIVFTNQSLLLTDGSINPGITGYTGTDSTKINRPGHNIRM